MIEFSRDLTGMKVIEDFEKESLTFVRSKLKVIIGALIVFSFMGCWVGAFFYALYEEFRVGITSGLYMVALSLFAAVGCFAFAFVVPKIKESYGERITMNKVSDSVFRNQNFISNLSQVKDVWLDEVVNYDSDNGLNLYVRFDDGSSLLIDSGGDAERFNKLIVKLESFLNRTTFRSKNV